MVVGIDLSMGMRNCGTYFGTTILKNQDIAQKLIRSKAYYKEFQDENERKMMIQIADMQKKVVREEADRLESMSAWKARILGITKEDAI